MVGINRVVTHGTFQLDGGSWDVDNNVWVVGDDTNVVVFDAAHTAQPIIDVVAGRNVIAVICTHGHNDHVTVAPELGNALDAPVLLHPADRMLWGMTQPDEDFRPVADGDVELRALLTPGHSPGSVCWYAPELGAVFSGDTLFQGDPGATGAIVLGLPNHPGLDLGPPRRPACRHGRLHRARRNHHRRRRSRTLRQVGGSRPLRSTAGDYIDFPVGEPHRRRATRCKVTPPLGRHPRFDHAARRDRGKGCGVGRATPRGDDGSASRAARSSSPPG